jgi:hypothetical protein
MVQLYLQPTCAPANSGCATPSAPSAGFTITTAADTTTVYPLVTGLNGATTKTAEYVVGPLWPVAGFAQSWGYTGSQTPWTNPSTWGTDPTYGPQPWRIPHGLAVSDGEILATANQPAQVTFADGKLTKLAFYSRFPR